MGLFSFQQQLEAASIFTLFEQPPFTKHGLFQCSERDSGVLLKQVLVKLEDGEVHIAAQLDSLDTASVVLTQTPQGVFPVVLGHETTTSDEDALKFILGYLHDIRFEMEKRQRQSSGGSGNKDGYYVEARPPSAKNETYIANAIADEVFSEVMGNILRRMAFRVQGCGSKKV